MERYLRTVKDTAAVCNIYQHQINRGPLEHLRIHTGQTSNSIQHLSIWLSLVCLVNSRHTFVCFTNDGPEFKQTSIGTLDPEVTE
jgi:hypothetical protein